MLFKQASGRLNFFFGNNCWLLLQLDENEPDQAHSTALRNACRHWGSRLVFPTEIQTANFEESSDAWDYWTRHFPGLELLHRRKQHILIRDLAASYDPANAARLLCRKLNLPLEGWGYLVWIGARARCYSLSIPAKPEPAAWNTWISAFYCSDLWEPYEPEFADYQDDPLTAAYRQYESSHEIPEAFAQLLRFLVMNDRNSALLSLLRAAERQLVPMRLNFYRCSLEFPELGKEARMQPLPFALYNLYLGNENGFANKERFSLKPVALDFYRRVRSGETDQALDAALDPCFDVRDDAPFRDAVYKANRAIEKVLGKNPFSRWYSILGPRGGKRLIALPRNLVLRD